MSGTLDTGTVSGTIEFQNKFSEVTATFMHELGELGDKFKDFGEHVKDGIEDPLGKAKEMVHSFLEEIGPVGAGVLAIGTAVAALGVGMFELAEHAAEAGEKVLSFSRITGTSVSEIGALSAAATIGGSSLDGLQGMLFQMQRRMDASGPAADKFNKALTDLHLNADQFRSADPTERIGLLSEAMHGAAGSTTLMTDAIALMGRGAMTSMPLLMKDFEDLKQQGEELGYQWSDADVKASEKFSEATAGLGVALSTMATTIGVALLPMFTALVSGATRTVQAFEHIVDLGGLVSGSWEKITGWMGRYALESETAGAVTDTTNKMWADAAKEGKSLGDAAFDVADKMLALGFNIGTVSEQTGLSTEAVKEMVKEHKNAAAAGQEYSDAEDRLNEALWGTTSNVDKVSSSMKGWIKDLKDAGTENKDLATLTGLTSDQITKLVGQINEADAKAKKLADTQEKEAVAAAKKYAAAMDDLNSSGETWQQTLDMMDGTMVTTIQSYLDAGVSAKTLEVVYERTPAQMKAIEDSRKSMIADLKLEAESTLMVQKVWETYYEKQDSFRATDAQKVQSKADRDYDIAVDEAQKKGIVDVSYYDGLWALREQDVKQNSAGQADIFNHSREFLELTLQNAQDKLQEALSSGLNMSSQYIDTLHEKIDEAHDALDKFSDGFDKLNDVAQKAMDITKQIQLGDGGHLQAFAQVDYGTVEGQAEANSGKEGTMSDYLRYYGVEAGPALFAAHMAAVEAGRKKLHDAHVPGFAAGTSYAPGGWAMVGEQGPEAMYVPQGASIIPNGGGPGGQAQFDALNAQQGAMFIANGNKTDAAQQKITRQMEAIAATLGGWDAALRGSGSGLSAGTGPGIGSGGSASNHINIYVQGAFGTTQQVTDAVKAALLQTGVRYGRG